MNWTKLQNTFTRKNRGHRPVPSADEPPFLPNPDHYYIISFPKSGNTWIRFLIAHVLHQGKTPITFQQLGSIVPNSHYAPDVKIIHDSNSLFHTFPVQFVKSHETYSPKFHNVIYIVRDGRDVLTSYYHWINARLKEHHSVADLIRGKTYFGLWSDHVMGWLQGTCRKKLIIKYEDLLDDTQNELRKIVSFAGLRIAPSRLQQAVESASFTEMRQMEKAHGIFEGHTEAIKKVPFVRKGSQGDWKNLFTQSDVELFWKYQKEAMLKMHYES